MEQITAEVRVTAEKIQPFAYKDGKGEMVGGESLELRASGFWANNAAQGRTPDYFPISVHFTVYPGHGIIPAIGDTLSIFIQREN